MSRNELSERQAADLLRRAAQLQARADETHGPGLTIDEVARAAEAAGIDRVYVEQAALGAGDDLPPSEPFLGMKTGARRSRVVPGAVSDAEWGKMVVGLRRQLGGTGEVESIGGMRSWRRDPYHVLLEPEGTTTRITTTASWRGDAIGAVAFTALLVALVVMMTAAALDSGNTALWIVSALFALGALVSAATIRPRLWAKGPRIEGKLDRTLDALAELAASEEVAEALADAPPIQEAARLDPSLLSAESGASGSAHSRRQTGTFDAARDRMERAVRDHGVLADAPAEDDRQPSARIDASRLDVEPESDGRPASGTTRERA